MRVLQCTRLVNDIIAALQGRERGFPRLCGMLGTVSENTEIVKEIEAVFDPRCETDLPDLSKHNSYIVDLLKTEEGKKMWDEMKTKKTSKGVTLAKCIKTGMDNKGHPNIKTVGLVGGDEECFDLIADADEGMNEQYYNKLRENVSKAVACELAGEVDSQVVTEFLT